MWLVVSLVDNTIKLSRRNCFVFVPRQSNCPLPRRAYIISAAATTKLDQTTDHATNL